MSIPVEIVGRSLDLTDWLLVAAAIVQALGSVAAIVAVAWITNHDRAERARAAQKARDAAVISLLVRTAHLIRSASAHLPELAPPFDKVQDYLAFSGQAHRARIKHIASALEAVPLYELGDDRLIDAVLDMTRSAHDAELAFADLERGITEPGEATLGSAAALAWRALNSLNHEHSTDL